MRCASGSGIRTVETGNGERLQGEAAADENGGPRRLRGLPIPSMCSESKSLRKMCGGEGGVRELHATNLQRSMNSHFDLFQRAKVAEHWPTAEKAFLDLMSCASVVMSESKGARIEADALAAELSVFRKTRLEEPAAPLLEDFDYVFSSRAAWVSVSAVQSYHQEHMTTDTKTECGKKVAYQVRERFTSGGWPRLRELCPECTEILITRGLFPESLLREEQ